MVQKHSSQLQPLDVLVNKPFKHLIHKHYIVWLKKIKSYINTLVARGSLAVKALGYKPEGRMLLAVLTYTAERVRCSMMSYP
jgi:hypothetical protein